MPKKSIWDQLDTYQDTYGKPGESSGVKNAILKVPKGGPAPPGEGMENMPIKGKQKRKKRRKAKGMLDAATKKMSGRDAQIKRAMDRAMGKNK